MNWASDDDAALCGELDAVRVLDRVEVMAALGTHDREVNVCAIPLLRGGVALAALTERGVVVFGVAAEADMPHVTGDTCLPVAEVFGRAWPDTWLTKRRLRRDAKASAMPGYEAGWACGWMPNATGSRTRGSVVLAKVDSHDGGRLLRIIPRPDAPAMDVAQHPATRWWPLGQHAKGLEALWEREVTGAPTYGLLVVWAMKAATPRRERTPYAGSTGRKRPDLTPEEQSRRAQKAWATRRARANLDE